MEQYFTVVLFVFQVSPVCNFGKFSNFGLGTVKSEGVKNCFITAMIISDIHLCSCQNDPDVELELGVLVIVLTNNAFILLFL